MKGFRFGFLAVTASILLVVSISLVLCISAADYKGLWVGTATLRQVGRINKRIPDLRFDLKLVGVIGNEEISIIPEGSKWKYAAPPQAPAGDTSWETGVAPFGFGEDPNVIKTILTPGGDGTLSAWGSHSAGQLGLGYGIGIQRVPAPVGAELPEVAWQGVTCVTMGESHTVAIDTNGSLWSWGANDFGQLGLGDGTATYLVSPVKIGDETDNWSSVAAGAFHTVAIDANGTLWSWGANDFGQLGLGDNGSTYIGEPTKIGTETWSSVAAGRYHTLAIRDGMLYAWGANHHGQAGQDPGTYPTISTPMRIGESEDWVKVAAGDYHSVAINDKDDLLSWGANNYGQLGRGDDANQVEITPDIVEADAKWVSVAAGGSHTVAIDKSYKLWAWGANDFGQLGLGDDDERSAPELIDPNRTWTWVAAGRSHTIAQKTDNTLCAWGANHYGQLGLGDRADVKVVLPKQIAPPTVGVTWRSVTGSVTARADQTAAIDAQGRLWAWGANHYGQLGLRDKTEVKVEISTQIGINQWIAADMGRSHTVAIRSDNTLWAWGSNGYGQLGLGPGAPKYAVAPTEILITDPPNDSPWILVAAGAYHTVAIKEDHTLWAWGANYWGQLGNGTTEGKKTPIWIGDETDMWSSVAAGAFHTVAIKEDHTLWAWGSNSSGQLGLGPNAPKYAVDPIKTDPNNDSHWILVTAGTFHTVAIKEDGTLWAWGANDFGQLGLGEDANQAVNTPKEVDPNTKWDTVAAGAFHTVAIKEDGTLWAWGANDFGQLGLGEDANQVVNTPKEVDPNTKWDTVAAGAFHTVAVSEDGRLWAWGANDSGQLGDGKTENKHDPVQIGTCDTWGCLAAGTWHTAAIKSLKSTFYFSHEFTIDPNTIAIDPNKIDSLKLFLCRDDGAVVYLNDHDPNGEIMRTNMPSGDIRHGTPPLKALDSGEEGLFIVWEIDRSEVKRLIQTGENILMVEIHQHPAELIDAADDVPALTRTTSPLELRFLLHQDSVGTVRLLKEVIATTVYDLVTGELRPALFIDHKEIARFRLPSEAEGRRISAVGFDFEGASILDPNNPPISRDATLTYSFELRYDHPTNPFLHRYHPDHDNLDEKYEEYKSSEEAYTIKREITIEFNNRYPPDKYENMRIPPPEWGDTMLGGSYKEIITGLHKAGGIEVSGPFLLQRVSTKDELNN